jgi:endonuclease YncB( thermonuclease family)
MPRVFLANVQAIIGGPLLFLLTSIGFAGEISGFVADVQDGDSISIVHIRDTYRIRLAEIDAPELSQEGGKESRSSLRELCLFKNATADASGEDRYGRTLARVKCAGVYANAEQVRRGWAWVFVRFAPKNSELYEVERRAKEQRLGLWRYEAPAPPWEWRQRNRER